jgi:hypothetical protein
MISFSSEQAANLYAARLRAEGKDARVAPGPDPAEPVFHVTEDETGEGAAK